MSLVGSYDGQLERPRALLAPVRQALQPPGQGGSLREHHGHDGDTPRKLPAQLPRLQRRERHAEVAATATHHLQLFHYSPKFDTDHQSTRVNTSHIALVSIIS